MWLWGWRRLRVLLVVRYCSGWKEGDRTECTYHVRIASGCFISGCCIANFGVGDGEQGEIRILESACDHAEFPLM